VKGTVCWLLFLIIKISKNSSIILWLLLWGILPESFRVFFDSVQVSGLIMFVDFANITSFIKQFVEFTNLNSPAF
jgi:hypothetical protein